MSDTDHNIRIDVQTRYLPEQSLPESHRYVFAYTITIHNEGSVAARLTHRHWYITDANGQEEQVHGEGVIGKQPYLHPGEHFEYTSGTILNTPVGAMHGHYDMTDDLGTHFIANIRPFTLAIPHSLN